MDNKHEKFSSYLESLGFEKDDDDLLDDNDPCLKFMFECGQMAINLHINENQFDIYYNFAYSDVDQEICEQFSGIEAATQSEEYEELINNLLEDTSKYWKRKALLSVIGHPPTEELDECSIYCPGTNEYYGNSRPCSCLRA